MQITVPHCHGTGCKANGADHDCAWCIFDMAKCTKSYGSACEETAAARAAQNAECNPKPMKNIVELAESVDSLSTLVAAVVAGDLVATLSSPGPFTVFAPTNDAFGALPAGTLDTLMKPENKATLVDILTYHVVGAAALSTDLSDGQMIGTVEGKSVTVHIGDGIKINDATVVMADVMASNGVVHVVDGVLLPPSRDSDGPTMNIVELAQATDSLSTLVAAVVAGDLVRTLSSEGPFTVFAPTNDAFGALPAGTLDTLLKPENQAPLVDILTYHVLIGQVLSTDLIASQEVATVEGKILKVTKDASGVKVGANLEATVVAADVLATNGVVHVIDAVMLPPSAIEVGQCIASGKCVDSHNAYLCCHGSHKTGRCGITGTGTSCGRTDETGELAATACIADGKCVYKANRDYCCHGYHGTESCKESLKFDGWRCGRSAEELPIVV